MTVIAIDANFNSEYLQFLLELGAREGVQNDRNHHIYQANEVKKELRPLLFEIFEFFDLHRQFLLW